MERLPNASLVGGLGLCPLVFFCGIGYKREFATFGRAVVIETVSQGGGLLFARPDYKIVGNCLELII